MLLGIQPEVETLQMFIFPVRDCVPGTPCVLRGNQSQSGQCMCDRGLPNAGDLHSSPCDFLDWQDITGISLRDSLT